MRRDLIRSPLFLLLSGLLLVACGDAPEARLLAPSEESLGTRESALCAGLSVTSLTLSGISSYEGVMAGSGSWAVSTSANAVRLEYYVDGALRSSTESPGSSGTWHFSESGITCGSHFFEVKAYPMVIDSAGNRTICWGSVRTVSQPVTENSPCLCNQLSQQSIGYGQMGYHDSCRYRDTCASGLVPHNVDPFNGNAKAATGYFSCWHNWPDVNCYSKPKINDYINVRICHTQPDGTKIDYGCGCP